MKSNNHIIIIAGGSFHGKSLISLALAARLKFSGVLTTDAVRNILKVLNPDKEFLGTSTYLLSDDSLAKQMQLVSDTLKQVIEIYQIRGERMIIEGMHFSSDFFKWSEEKKLCRICIDNQLSFEKRVDFKRITRTNLRKIPSEELQPSDNELRSMAYFQHEDRMKYIHGFIIEQAKQHDYQIVQFANIDDGIETAMRHIESYTS